MCCKSTNWLKDNFYEVRDTQAQGESCQERRCVGFRYDTCSQPNKKRVRATKLSLDFQGHTLTWFYMAMWELQHRSCHLGQILFGQAVFLQPSAWSAPCANFCSLHAAKVWKDWNPTAYGLNYCKRCDPQRVRMTEEESVETLAGGVGADLHSSLGTRTNLWHIGVVQLRPANDDYYDYGEEAGRRL